MLKWMIADDLNTLILANQVDHFTEAHSFYFSQTIDNFSGANLPAPGSVRL
jgi:hypothetical protein